MCKKVYLFFLLFSLFIFQSCNNGLEGNRIEIDYGGVSKLYLVNAAAGKIICYFERDAYFDSEDTTGTVSIELGDTAYLASFGGIGGWLQPLEVLTSIVCILSSNGDTIHAQTPLVDSLWEYSESSTFEMSHWYYSVH